MLGLRAATAAPWRAPAATRLLLAILLSQSKNMRKYKPLIMSRRKSHKIWVILVALLCAACSIALPVQELPEQQEIDQQAPSISTSESPEQKALRSIQSFKRKFGLKNDYPAGGSVRAVETTIITEGLTPIASRQSELDKENTFHLREKRKKRGDGSGRRGRKGEGKTQMVIEVEDAGNEFDEFTSSYKRAGEQIKKMMNTRGVSP